MYIIIGFIIGRDLKYVLISSLTIFLKQKLWILFGPFQDKIVIKSLKIWVHFVADIGKMVIEIIRRNGTSTTNMRVFILPGTSGFISDHMFGGHFREVYEYHWNGHSYAPW